MEVTCRICQKSRLVDRTGICDECQSQLGVRELPPSRRRAAPCTRCNGQRFVRVVPRELSARGNDYVTQVAAPMAATHAVHTKANFLLEGHTVAPPGEGHGVLEIRRAVPVARITSARPWRRRPAAAADRRRPRGSP